NFFCLQQDRCSTCGNDVHALAFQRASKLSDTGCVRNGNESAANFHEDVNRDSLNRYIDLRFTNYDSREASAIEQNVFGHRIQHWAAADGFAKCLAEMTQARIADFCGRFGNVI